MKKLHKLYQGKQHDYVIRKKFDLVAASKLVDKNINTDFYP
jgi:hypothetical protein